jgi:hypothetical protein
MAEGAPSADGEVRTLWVGDLVRPRASTLIASAVIFHVAATRLGGDASHRASPARRAAQSRVSQLRPCLTFLTLPARRLSRATG